MRPPVRLFVSLLALSLAGVVSGAASAEDVNMSVKVQNSYPAPVQFGLFSQNRKKAWVYGLSDHAQHTVNISCQPGESVCVGAWQADNLGVRWGVGYNGDGDCDDCCYICGEDQPDDWDFGAPG